MKQKLLKSIGRAIPMLILSLLLCTAAFAQRPITGKVMDAYGQPVSGATVAVKGSNVATSTAPDGTFALSVPNDRGTLVVSYIGFDGIEVAIAGASNLNITLKERSSSLSEVVVTGYTSQAKKDITGSVAVVNTADLKSIPLANAESQLQGRAAGVNVTIDNRPGAGADVRIRGFASFGDNQPLYIIDGVPTGGLGGLNPNDIESMQVLKDAASASIYGARASNGVIIVTTSKDARVVPKFLIICIMVHRTLLKGWDLLNSQEMADLTFLAFSNANQTTPTTQYGTGTNPVLPDYILPAGKFEGDPAVDPALYNLDLMISMVLI